MATSRSPIAYADELPAVADVAVVGGGIVGCATAFFAARAGLRVVVVERRPRLATLTTAASTGAFRLQFDNQEEIELVREGVELFAEFGLRTGLDGWDIGLRQQGYLFCSLTAESAERARRLVDRQRDWGLTDVEVLSGDEARARFSYLSPDIVQARYRAADGWLDPRRLAFGYAAAASAPARIPDAVAGGGAVFCVGTTVTGMLRQAAADAARGDTVTGVQTDRGDVAAAAVVIAAGPFSGEVAALAALDVEIRPTRRQKLALPDLPAVPTDAPMTIDDETAAHWRPGMRGAHALWTEAETPPSAPAEDVPVEAAWAFGLLDPASDHALARVSPFWRDVWGDPSAGWYLQAGQYEYTPDHRPYIGATMVPGLHLNAGYSGHGVMASTAASRLLVDLLVGRVDDAANPFRHARPTLGRERDVL